MRLTAQIYYFAIVEARDHPTAASFTTRFAELADELPPSGTAEESAALIAACDRQWPLARAEKAIVALPVDPVKLELMCIGIVGIMNKTADDLAKDPGDYSQVIRVKPTYEKYVDGLTDARLAAAGIEGVPAIQKALEQQAIASLDLGHALNIESACAAALLH